MQPVIVPQDRVAPLDSAGGFVRNWYLFFKAAADAIAAIAYPLKTTQAKLPAVARKLSQEDKGTLVEITDYNHFLRWTGAAWEFPPNEASDYFVDGSATAPAPSGWHPCDGSTVNYLKSDGTLGSRTLPTAATAGYVKTGAAYTGAPVAATAPGLSGSTASGTTGLTIPANTGTPSASTTFPQGTGANVTVASSTHTHSEGAVTDPGHTHTLGTLAADALGEPAHTVYVRWFRQ